MPAKVTFSCLKVASNSAAVAASTINLTEPTDQTSCLTTTKRATLGHPASLANPITPNLILVLSQGLSPVCTMHVRYSCHLSNANGKESERCVTSPMPHFAIIKCVPVDAGSRGDEHDINTCYQPFCHQASPQASLVAYDRKNIKIHLTCLLLRKCYL